MISGSKIVEQAQDFTTLWIFAEYESGRAVSEIGEHIIFFSLWVEVVIKIEQRLRVDANGAERKRVGSIKQFAPAEVLTVYIIRYRPRSWP